MKDLEKMCNDAFRNGEPVFMIRARDKASIAALIGYINACEELDCPQEHLNEITIIKNEFLEWQEENETKIPD